MPEKPSAAPPCVLAIAGSDSGGGAGIQADLKAFARCGVHGMTAVTAITAQNTREVSAVAAIEPGMVVAQVAAVARDLGVDAVKIGMLGDEATILAVEEALSLLPDSTPVVLDPVMVAESGAQLLAPAARDALVARLLPRATVVTPNLPEASVLSGGVGGLADGASRAGEADAEELARAVHRLGPAAVVVTGGHREAATDVFYDGSRLEAIPGPCFADGASHGSGCTHSSALAAHLALGYEPLEAARRAKALAAEAVRQGLHGLGEGAGPVDVLGIVARTATRPGGPRS